MTNIFQMGSNHQLVNIPYIDPMGMLKCQIETGKLMVSTSMGFGILWPFAMVDGMKQGQLDVDTHPAIV